MIGGPGTVGLDQPNAEKPQAKHLTEGIYTFELKVTDNDGLIGKDSVQVTVGPPGSLIIFENLEWETFPHRALVIKNIRVVVDLNSSFQVYIQETDLFGVVSRWILIPSKADIISDRDSYYEILNGNFEIYMPKIDCNFDPTEYDLTIKLR